MKINKTLLIAAIVSISGILMPSCSESFLNEELITSRNTEYFKIKLGLDDLSTGLYPLLKFKFNYIWGLLLFGRFAGQDGVVVDQQAVVDDVGHADLLGQQLGAETLAGPLLPTRA